VFAKKYFQTKMSKQWQARDTNKLQQQKNPRFQSKLLENEDFL